MFAFCLRSPSSSTGSTINAQQYKGQELAYRADPDAGPELQYALHFRQYDPHTARFTSRDPAEDDLNLYRYVKNNPVNSVDPSGLDEVDDKSKAVSEKYKPRYDAISNKLQDYQRYLASMQETLDRTQLEHTVFAMLENNQAQFDRIKKKHEALIKEHNRVGAYYTSQGGHVHPWPTVYIVLVEQGHH